MKRFIFVLLISLTTLSLSGCNDLFAKFNTLFSSEEVTPDDIYKNKLKSDLKAFDSIRVEQNSIFFELNEKLHLATKKETSTAQLRAELQSFASSLIAQNDRFTQLHLHTTEVAKLRNKVMQLNYATIKLIEVVDNPDTVQSRLRHYLSQQKTLINDYNKLRSEAEGKL